MTTTNYYNNADPTSGSSAQSDKILNLGNAYPLAGDVLFPSGDPLVTGASSFYPTSFAAAPQYNQESPTAGPVENLFEGVLPGGFNTESVETNPDDTQAMRLSIAQPQSAIGKNKHMKPIKKGRYSLEQKRLLEQALNSDPNPSADKISSLAQQTGLAETQIINWFSRQRKSGDVSKNSSDSGEESSVSSTGGNKSPRRDEEKPARNAETILAPYIQETGGITRIEHMAKCHQLMQEEKNVEQRLFIVTVLSESSVNSLRYFAFDLNGLAILDEWLQQYRKDNKVLLIKRILKVLTKTPITLDVLTKTSIGKTVNSIVKKATDEVVRELGRALVEKWKQLVQTDQTRPTTPEQTRKNTPSPPTTRTTPGGLRISNEGRPPATAVRPTPMHSNGIEASDDFETTLGSVDTQPRRKTSLGFDHLRRQKHGIQLKDDLQSEDDRLKRLGNKPVASKPMSIDDIKRKKAQKKIMREASLGNLSTMDTSHIDVQSSPEPSSDEGDEPAAKRRKISSDREEVTQVRPSSPVLLDSDFEMNDSYNSAAHSNYNSHSVEDDDMGDMPVDLEAAPEDATLPDVVLPSTPPLQTTPIIDEGSMTPRLMDSEDQETPPSRKRKRKGLSVRWAPDEQLTQIRLFDKEEASVHAQRDFKAAARAEHSNEKLSNDTIKKQEEDEWKERAQNMVPTIVWNSPAPIDFSKSVVKLASADSPEARRLAQREQEQMMVSYWNDAQIPPNPKEAPAEANVGQAQEPVVINPNVPLTSDSLTQLLSSLQNKVGAPAPPSRQAPMPAQMQQQHQQQQQQFNNAPLLFNNNTMPQQQFMQQPILPQQNIQNLLLSLAGQGLLNPILAVAQQTQQMGVNPLLNLGAQPHNPGQVQHQQSYSHHQGGRGGYHNNNSNQHYNNNNDHHYNNNNQYGHQGHQGHHQGRGGYNQNYDRGGHQGHQGRGGFDDRRGRGGQRGGGQSRGGGPRGNYRGNRGGYN
jgi:hypothetical protein